MDKTKNMLTMINPTEYTRASWESTPANSALIIRARKLLKKITKQPCLQHIDRSAADLTITNVGGTEGGKRLAKEGTRVGSDALAKTAPSGRVGHIDSNRIGFHSII